MSMGCNGDYFLAEREELTIRSRGTVIIEARKDARVIVGEYGDAAHQQVLTIRG